MSLSKKAGAFSTNEKRLLQNTATAPFFVILSVSEGSFLWVCSGVKDSSPLWGSE